MFKSLFIASAVCAGLMVQPVAAAEDTVKGVTLEELEAALSTGFKVQRDTLDSGSTFLIVLGRSHVMAAQMITCGGDANCHGVRYFSILKTAPSATAINKFNLDPNYSKVALSDSGKAIISIDHYVGGGVTAENLLRTGAVLMAGMSRLGETQNIAAAEKAATTAPLSFDAAWAAEGLSKDRAGLGRFSVDPALMHLLAQRVEATP